MSDVIQFTTPTNGLLGNNAQIDYIKIKIYWSTANNQNINPYPILSSELIVSNNRRHRVIPNINPRPILSREFISSISVRTTRTLNVFSLRSNEFLSNIKTYRTSNNINIVDTERFINPKLITIASINPKSINEFELFSNTKLESKIGIFSLASHESFLDKTNLNRSINCFNLNDRENISRAQLNIEIRKPQLIGTQELTPRQNISPTAIIKPHSINSVESISSNILFAYKILGSSPILSSEVISLHKTHVWFYESFNAINFSVFQTGGATNAHYMTSNNLSPSLNLSPGRYSLVRRQTNDLDPIPAVYSYYDLKNANPDFYLTESIPPISNQNWLVISGWVRFSNVTISSVQYNFANNNYAGFGFALQKNNATRYSRRGYWIYLDTNRSDTFQGLQTTSRTGDFRLVKVSSNETVRTVLSATNIDPSRSSAPFINTDLWYRIVVYTRSTFNPSINQFQTEIYAKLYQGESGVPIATLQYTDAISPYTEGTIGLAGLRPGAFFDNITVIPPKFIGYRDTLDGTGAETNISLTPQEINPSPIIVVGNSNLRLGSSILSTENINRPRINSIINNFSISTYEFIKNQNISPSLTAIKLNPILSTELINIPVRQLFGTINVKTILSSELLNKHVLSAGNVSILPSNIDLLESLSRSSVRSILNSKSIIEPNEFISRLNLSATNRIRPTSLVNVFENINIHNLFASKIVSTYNIESLENLNQLFVKPNVYNLNVSTLLSEEKFENIKLNAQYQIFAKNILDIDSFDKIQINLNIFSVFINTEETFKNSNLISNINSFSIESSESMSFNFINAVSSLKLQSINSLELISKKELIQRDFLKPESILSEELISYSRAFEGKVSIKPKAIDIYELTTSPNTYALSTIKPLEIITEENSNVIRLNSTRSINAIGLLTSENLNTIKTYRDLFAKTIATFEQFVNDTVFRAESIIPSTINTVEAIELSTVSNIAQRIRPLSVIDREQLQLDWLYVRFYETFESGEQTYRKSSLGTFDYVLDNSISIYPGFSLTRQYSGTPTALGGYAKYSGFYKLSSPTSSQYNDGKLYYSGWIYINDRNFISGLAFLMGNTYTPTNEFNTNNGYLVILDPILTPSGGRNFTFGIMKGIRGNAFVVRCATASPYILKMNTWYRIVSTSELINADTVRIEASFYEGTSGTPIRTLVFEDTGNLTVNGVVLGASYKSGNLGVYSTGTPSGYFDHLTNIPPQFSFIATLRSQEIFARPIISRSILFGNRSIASIERFAIPSVRSLITPYNLTAQENVNNLNLNLNVFNIKPFTLNSEELIPKLEQRLPGKIYVYNILSLELFNDFNYNATNVNITPLSISSIEFINQLSLSINYNLIPSSIISSEEVNNINLISNAYISPYNVEDINFISAFKVNAENIISPYMVLTSETINAQNVIRLFKILPDSIDTIELLPELKLDSTFNIYPFVIETNELFESINSSRLNAIRPSTVITSESIQIHRLNLSQFGIQPDSIKSEEIFGNHLLSANQYSLKPYSILSLENIPSANINTNSTFINPYVLNSEELIGNHKIDSIFNINPYSILSIENYDKHLINAYAFINPSTIATLEIISSKTYVELKNRIIEAISIQSEETITKEFPLYCLSRLSPSKFASSVPAVVPPAEYDEDNFIYLTLDGNNIFTWDRDYDFIITVNDSAITQNYILDTDNGLLILTSPVSLNDVIKVCLFDETYNSAHVLYTEAWIYPYSILTSEIVSRKLLRGPVRPGYVHSWFEKLNEIESLINYKSAYQTNTIESWIEILENINISIQFPESKR